MTQTPMLRAEVYARALRASQNRKEDSKAGVQGSAFSCMRRTCHLRLEHSREQ